MSIRSAVIGLLVVFVALSASGTVVISEFMAKNGETLMDGDGNYSDWIELYNTGDSAVDLTGWYLTDDTNDLVQWSFPSKSIGAGEYLVVFASGQDAAGYTDSLGYLHTNFKLSGDGENVVLTRSDGVTVEAAFYEYPDQDDDVSFGLGQDSSFSYLVVEEQDARALVGTYEPDASWKTSGFDDSGWLSGQLGVGYGIGPSESLSYTSLINLDVSSMFRSTESCFIRVAFDVTDPSAMEQLALRMRYDDGFVAYINGTEVVARNVPASPTYSSQATNGNWGLTYENFTITGADSLLQSGENVLAILGLNKPLMAGPGSVEEFSISPVLTGITVGDLLTNSVMYYETATPGAANVSGVLGYVEDTEFSVDRGFYTNSFEVEISCDTEGAAIYYTVDGTTPSAVNGTLYNGPVTIDKTTVLRATATKTGYQSSDTDTQTYIFLDDIIAQGTDVSGLAPAFPSSSVNGQEFDYGMDTAITESSTYSSQIAGALLAIPTISMVTDPDNLFDSTSGIYVHASEEGEAWERETSIELINPDGSKGFQINGGMRIRGESSTSSSNPKHSFRFLFKSEYGTARLNYPLFGDEGADSFKRMDLRTGQNFSWANQSPEYATWLYDIFTRDTHRDMDQPYTRGEYCHLYINGMYWGLYQTEERCDKRFAESYYGDDDEDYDAVKADGDTGVMYAVDGTRDAYDTLWSAINSGVSSDSAYFALQGLNADGTGNSSYTKLLDVDNVIDYMLLVYFTANRDSPIGPPHMATMPRNLNAIYNRSNPDGFKFVAHDNEHSLEISEGVYHNRFSQSLSSTFDQQDYFTPWWMHLKLMQNDEYALRFADHVHEYFYNNGALTAAETASRLETRKNEIYAAVVAESARWGDSASYSARTRDDDWLTQANWLLYTYMPQRSAIVLGQIEDQGWYPSVAAPEFNQHGGSIASGFSLSMSGSGTLYYTTDGSDPRAVGGLVAGSTYSGAITLDKSTQVKARALNGGVWSALTKATFVVNETSPLRVTEIMYHPAEVALSGVETNYSNSDFEYIEILNTGEETIGLAGTEFAGGVYFDFADEECGSLAAGEYAVLVSNYGAFTNRYTNWASIHILGEYHGKFCIRAGALDNGGEQIVLRDGLGNTILDFEYEDWYAITDGDGYSLTLSDPYNTATSDFSDSTSWRPSAYEGGTPGYAAVEFPGTGALVINEVLSHQDDDTPGDWIELYNASDETLDINGWFLSDDDDDLTKIELSGLGTIGPGSYLVLTEAAHFGTNVSGINGFAFSELGDEVYLSSGESGSLTGYRVEEDFGAAERDVTFGRYVKSDGSTDFPAMSRTTYGAVNAYPAVGPVVISEIMYHPATTDMYEFVELYNDSSSSVALYDAAYPTNTWRLDGAVEFSFPQGFSMAAGSYVIISETTPAAFSNAYILPVGAVVLGPYDGRLDNDGESLRLEKPGDPEALTGEVPEILVERVKYEDNDPWPAAADGGGYSLRRVAMDKYGNDSANWTRSSGAPTPGQGDTNYVCEYSQMAVAGSFNSWNAAGNMTLVDNNTWQWCTTISGETSVEFKFAADGAWDANWGDDDPSGSALPLFGSGDWYGANIQVSDTLSGSYVFTFNDRTKVYSLSAAASGEDADGDGMDDDWEELYFGATDAVNGGADDDPDGDGASNEHEFVAGTDPTDEASVFVFNYAVAAGDGCVFEWEKVSGKVYSLWGATDLLDENFVLVASDLSMGSYTAVVGTSRCAFYKLQVEDQ